VQFDRAMTERDAFGRQKGEDPLEDLGWSSSSAANRSSGLRVPVARGDVPKPDAPLEDLGWSTSSAANRTSGLAVPVSAEQLRGDADAPHQGIPGSHAPAPMTFRDREPSGGGMPGGAQIDLRGLRVLGRLFRSLILLAILAAVFIGGGGALVDTISDEIDKIDEIESSKPRSPATPEREGPSSKAPTGQSPAPAQPAAPSEPPVGLQRGSLLLRANFASALRKMRNGGYGRLTNLRVAPERINATFLTKDGRLRNVQFQPGGAVRDFGTSGPGFSGARTMSIASINASAPFRAVSSAAGRLKKPASKVNYLVYTAAFSGQPWGVYFKDGQYFRADGRGAITRRFS